MTVTLTDDDKQKLKDTLLAFIERVADKDCTKKSEGEVAILPQMINLTAELFAPELLR